MKYLGPMRKRVVIYIRVSDPGQIDNNSLETQEKYCRKKASEMGAEVVEIFREEGVSAKTIDKRPELRRLLQFCSLKKNDIQAVIVYRLDRWSRNVTDALQAKFLLAKYGVQLISATEGITDDPQGEFLGTITFAMAQLDNQLKAARVSDNMKTMFRNGLWPWKVPPGYKRPFKTKEESKGKPAIIDPDIGPILHELFVEASKGIFSRKQLAEKTNLLGYADFKGRKINEKVIVDILSDTFYHGLMHAPRWDEYAVGLHEPLIDELTWKKAYASVIKKRKYMYQDTVDYPLKGTIKCELCDHFMTSSNPRGRTKNYKHYECGNPKCRRSRILASSAHEQFASILSRVKPAPDVMVLFTDMVFSEWDSVVSTVATLTQTLDKRIADQKKELDRISRSCDRGIYTEAEAKEKADEVRREITILEVEKTDSVIAGYDAKIVKAFTERFLEHFDELWKQLDLPKQQALQVKIFPNGILCDKNKNIRTAEMSECFQLIEALGSENVENVTPRRFELRLPG